MYGGRIAATQLSQPPLFILGHWRSGTTYLHELLSLDPRFASPTTYRCFAPGHFLLTEWLVAGYMGFLMPRQRPMDNMAAGWERPQEDEFALLALGAPTPYFRVAFPNDPPPWLEFLDMQNVTPADLTRFEQALTYFVKALSFRSSKQLLLKSPPHTGRLATLARLFPGAKFVHIARDPYALFASTRRLWESLDDVQGLQLPQHAGLDEYIFSALERMYNGFEQQQHVIAPENMCEVRYEELIANPVEGVASIYERLELGNFCEVRAAMSNFAGAQKDYQTNRHALEEPLKLEIRRRWDKYFTRFGYA
jgi:LPS sulfotransferase NodH